MRLVAEASATGAGNLQRIFHEINALRSWTEIRMRIDKFNADLCELTFYFVRYANKDVNSVANDLIQLDAVEILD